MKKISLFIPFLALSFLTNCQNATYTLSFNNFGVLIDDHGEYFLSKKLTANKKYTFNIKVDNDFKDIATKPTSLIIKNKNGEDYTKYTFNAENGEFTIRLNQDVTVTTNSYITRYPSLEESSWSFINKMAQLNLATELYKVGDEKTVYVNNLPHKVRIIGFNHDDLVDGSGKANITFEFMNPIEENNPVDPQIQPYSVYTSFWAFQDDNTQFIDQQLNMRLNYDRNSILSILPNDLQAVIKEVNKEIATGPSLELTNYPSKLFPLSYEETTDTISVDAFKEGETYQYYEEHKEDSDRTKTLINGDSFNGYWLRSPTTTVEPYAWHVDCKTNKGQLKHDIKIYAEDADEICSILPAFCI